MSFLYQHEKNLLLSLAEHYEKRSEHCKTRAMMPASNKKMYLQQAEKELEKTHVLRKAAS